MPRAKADPRQETYAWHLYSSGNGPTAILRQLKARFDNPVSTRTVANWVSRFKYSLENGKDRPFEWLTMDTHGIPWEASAFILDMWQFDRQHKPFPNSNVEIPEPTIRQVQWWWRVHQAIPELNRFDTWHLGQKFTIRDILAEVMEANIGSKDLQAYLSYKPWDKPESYLSSINNESIPKLLSRNDLLAFASDSKNWTPQCLHQFSMGMATEIWNSDEPLALPSENALHIPFSSDSAYHNVLIEERLAAYESRTYRYDPLNYYPDF